MEQSEDVPAAEYVRMSTEDQVYSIQNQRAGIQKYAEQHGFKVVQSYTDVGRTVLLQHVTEEAFRLGVC